MAVLGTHCRKLRVVITNLTQIVFAEIMRQSAHRRLHSVSFQ